MILRPATRTSRASEQSAVNLRQSGF